MPKTGPSTPVTPEIDPDRVSVTTRGDVAPAAEAYAIEKVCSLARVAHAPVLFAQARLTQEPDPSRDRPSIVEFVLDVNGEPVRAHVAAHELFAAIDLAEATLARRLERHGVRLRERARRPAGVQGRDEQGWRHGDRPTDRPTYFDRPREERTIIRRKSFDFGEMMCDEAVDLLDLLGHDFLVFRNLRTGSDAVVSYADAGLELIDASGRPDAIGPDEVAPLRLSARGALTCSVIAAVEELEDGREPFVFFVDEVSGRGGVVYHRYDGHYGVITPSAGEAEG